MAPAMAAYVAKRQQKVHAVILAAAVGVLDSAIIAGFCSTAVVSVFETGFLRIGTGVVAWTNPDLAWGVTRTA